MSTNYVSKGEVIQFANTGAAIASGSPVLVGTAIVGVALVNIEATTGVGSVALEGVFSLPKDTGELVAYSRPVWDLTSTKKFIAGAGAATDIVTSCIVMETAASAATTVKVKLTPATAKVKGGG